MSSDHAIYKDNHTGQEMDNLQESESDVDEEREEVIPQEEIIDDYLDTKEGGEGEQRQKPPRKEDDPDYVPPASAGSVSNDSEDLFPEYMLTTTRSERNTRDITPLALGVGRSFTS